MYVLSTDRRSKERFARWIFSQLAQPRFSQAGNRREKWRYVKKVHRRFYDVKIHANQTFSRNISIVRRRTREKTDATIMPPHAIYLFSPSRSQLQRIRRTLIPWCTRLPCLSKLSRDYVIVDYNVLVMMSHWRSTTRWAGIPPLLLLKSFPIIAAKSTKFNLQVTRPAGIATIRIWVFIQRVVKPVYSPRYGRHTGRHTCAFVQHYRGIG